MRVRVGVRIRVRVRVRIRVRVRVRRPTAPKTANNARSFISFRAN
jgi:hypothetical protein